MALIPIDQAEEGMVVSKDVMDNSGNLLIKAGVELTATWISRLEARGVSELYVEGGEPDVSEEESERLRVITKEKLDETFSEVKDNEIMSAIALYAEKYLMSKL